MFSYSLERAGGKFTVTPTGYILINDKIDRETADVHSFQVSFFLKKPKEATKGKNEELKSQDQRARMGAWRGNVYGRAEQILFCYKLTIPAFIAAS